MNFASSISTPKKFLIERQVIFMEIQYPELSSKIKAKWHMPATIAGSFTVLVTAFAFLSMYWNPSDRFVKSVLSPVTADITHVTSMQPRSDESETVVPSVGNVSDPATGTDNKAGLESGLPPKPGNPGDNDLNNAVAVIPDGSGLQNSDLNPDGTDTQTSNDDASKSGDPANISDKPSGSGGSGAVLPKAPDIVLTQETVRFKPDSSEFIDPDEAESIISKYANNLRGRSDAKIYVIGTAADTWGDTQVLSERRALAVLNKLIGLGVPENSLMAFGMSNQDPWHVQNIDENGTFLSDIAKVNRKVVIVMSGDDAAKVIDAQIIGNGKTLTLFYYKDGVLMTEAIDKLP